MIQMLNSLEFATGDSLASNCLSTSRQKQVNSDAACLKNGASGLRRILSTTSPLFGRQSSVINCGILLNQAAKSSRNPVVDSLLLGRVLALGRLGKTVQDS
ncbi:MAG: hypothetical protein ABJZ55_09585 [Fuerstiella sp.]